jgi:hypothetical protein
VAATGGAGTGGVVGTGGAATGGMTGAGGTGGLVVPGGPPCADIFAQALQTFSIDITPAELASIEDEFFRVGALPPDEFAAYDPVYHPVVFHYGSETYTDVFIRLKGQSSWRLAVANDGPRAKMQFVVAFDEGADGDAKFHGLGKIALDMPRNDVTFLHDRMANAWMRTIGVPALCVTSARLEINGSLYGVYSLADRVGGRFVKTFFPGNDDGDLFEGGVDPETNQDNPNWARLDTFWAASTPAEVAAIVDVPSSTLEWAAEAMLNDGDGYWGGAHNFYIYDQGAAGYVWIPNDLDATFDFLGRFTGDPIYWWSTRSGIKTVGQHYRIVIGDPTMRAQYVDAIEARLGQWNIAELQRWIDLWSAQIRDAVIADPHKPATTTPERFDAAVALARRGIQERSDFVGSWLSCQRSGVGADGDGDGVIWCRDCRDDNASVHPGAAEMCGNEIDENCNGLYDEECPVQFRMFGPATRHVLDGAVP